MKAPILRGFLLLIGLFSYVMTQAQNPQHGDTLTTGQKEYLLRYETVRAALAADDLPAAKTAAIAIPDNAIAAQLARSTDLGEARKSFFMLSRAVMKIAHGQPGYLLFHCPEAKFGEEWGHWVQINETPSNPYLGKANPSCGKIMK